MSAWNVIPDLHPCLAHITTHKAALKLNGKAYCKAWLGNGTSILQITSIAYQASTNAFNF